MENNIKIDAPNIILALGAIFGALIGFAKTGTAVSIIIGLIVGLAFAAFFNNVIIPHKASDR